MTHMGRHISPQKEGIAEKSSLGGTALLVLNCVLTITAFTALSQTAATQQVGAPSSTVLPQANAATLLPTTDPAISQDFNLVLPAARSTRLLDLNLDFDNLGCLVGEQNCLQNEPPVDMGFSTSISKNSKKGLDLELVPSASMRFDDDSRSAVVGAVVRIGEDLRSKDVSSNTWYIFAGADAEALSYAPESAKALMRGEFGLSDRIIIGDAQAGVGYRIGSADVSLGYFRREISTLNDLAGAESFSKTEDAAALSFTWKR